jgi:hypothetical protein
MANTVVTAGRAAATAAAFLPAWGLLAFFLGLLVLGACLPMTTVTPEMQTGSHAAAAGVSASELLSAASPPLLLARALDLHATLSTVRL